LAGYTSTDPIHGTLLVGTSALQCAAGVIGGGAGAAYDTVLFGVYIPLSATAATVTIAGMSNSSGAAANLLITGETTVDYFWMPPAPILNSFAAFVFTPSATNSIWVFTRAYVGPERPGTRVTT
jgi:hypothetical protein